MRRIMMLWRMIWDVVESDVVEGVVVDRYVVESE